MKKLTFWSVLMLMVMALSTMVACGSDDGEIEESSWDKFIRVSKINKEEYDFFRQVYHDELDNTSCFVAFEKNTEVFHCWVFNEKSNKIFDFQKNHDRSQKIYEGYGEYKILSLEDMGTYFTQSDMGKVIDIMFCYKKDYATQYVNFFCLLIKNDSCILLNESQLRERIGSDYKSHIVDWYNDSFAVSSLDSSTIIDKNGNIIKKIQYPVYYWISNYNYIELYDYDKGLCWGYHYNSKLGIYFCDFDTDVSYYEDFPFTEITGEMPSGLIAYDNKYKTEVLSSDERFCTVKITSIYYDGKVVEAVVKIDKKNQKAEYVQ